MIADGTLPTDIQLGDKRHIVTCEKGGEKTTYTGRWIIDAAGRQKLLKSKLNLHKDSGHKGNAVFFRVDKKIVIDEWSDSENWQQRLVEPGTRWLSTNHLMGPGYWVWIIPLGSGATSFGIVMDDQALAESKIESYDDALQWLRTEQPICADSLIEAKVLDFKVIKDYSYSCKQMYSDQGWAVTGEAGGFPDPFYSPGSDFIAIGNTFITDLIEKESRGDDIRIESLLFHKFYDSFFENTLSLYKGQYGGFGDRRMMSIKLVWDYTYYWGVLTLLFFTDSICDIELMRELNPNLLKAQKLNEKMQGLLNERAQKRLVLATNSVFMDQFLVPCLNQFNQVLKTKDIDVTQALASNLAVMEKVVPYFEDMLTDNPSSEISKEELAILGHYRQSVLA